MPFHLRYGEPDWDEPPTESPVFGVGILQRPLSDKSYEELRYEANEKQCASRIADLNIMALSSGATSSFVNLKNLNEIVEVIVGDGDDRAQWIIHQKLFINDSGLARRALSGDFKEKNERIIRFPEEHQDVFDLYCKFLYTGLILTFSLELLVQMYTLGDRLQSTKFINACYEAVKKSTEPWSAQQIRYCFDNLMSHDRLLEFCISQVGKGILAGRYSFSTSSEQDILRDFMPELMQGVTAAVAEMKGGTNKWYPKQNTATPLSENMQHATWPSASHPPTNSFLGSAPPRSTGGGGGPFTSGLSSIFGNPAPISSTTGFSTSSAPASTGGSGFGNQTSIHHSSGLFGSRTTQPSSTTNTGIFGSGTTQPSSTTNTGIFGSRTTQPSSTQHSSGLFGSGTTQPSSTTNTGLFGSRPTQPSSTTNTGIFGSGTTQPSATTNADSFGSPITQPSSTTTINLFGSRTAQPSSTTNLFGSRTTQPSSTTNTGIFGIGTTQPSSTQHSSGLFGSGTTQPSSTTNTGSFGSPTTQPSSTTNLFGNHTIQPSSATNIDPFGSHTTQLSSVENSGFSAFGASGHINQHSSTKTSSGSFGGLNVNNTHDGATPPSFFGSSDTSATVGSPFGQPSNSPVPNKSSPFRSLGSGLSSQPRLSGVGRQDTEDDQPHQQSTRPGFTANYSAKSGGNDVPAAPTAVANSQALAGTGKPESPFTRPSLSSETSIRSPFPETAASTRTVEASLDRSPVSASSHVLCEKSAESSSSPSSAARLDAPDKGDAQTKTEHNADTDKVSLTHLESSTPAVTLAHHFNTTSSPFPFSSSTSLVFGRPRSLGAVADWRSAENSQPGRTATLTPVSQGPSSDEAKLDGKGKGKQGDLDDDTFSREVENLAIHVPSAQLSRDEAEAGMKGGAEAKEDRVEHEKTRPIDEGSSEAPETTTTPLPPVTTVAGAKSEDSNGTSAENGDGQGTISAVAATRTVEDTSEDQMEVAKETLRVFGARIF